MQRITYVNAYGEQLVFGGEPPLLLRTVSGLSRPDAGVVLTQGAYQDGERFSRVQLPARFVQISFDMPPLASRGAMYAERMRMERVLSAGRCARNGEIGLMLYENDAGAWIAGAVPDGAISYGRRFQNGFVGGKLTLCCPDAFLQDRREQTVQLRMGQSGLVLPAALPVRLGARRFRTELVNGGTASAPVTMTLYGTGEMPSVVNHTTGARIVVSRTVASGEQLVIHTEPGALSCELVRADGTREDAFGYLDPTVALSAFLLVPGVNDVEYVPSVVSLESRMEMRWRSCYEGV